MNRLVALTLRSIRLFTRDKTAVFFSFLSTIILVALYFLFIARMYIDSMANVDGGMLSDAMKSFIVYAQMMAGVLVLNSLSLSMGVFGSIAKDFETRRVDSLSLTAASAHQLLLGYYFSGALVSFVLNGLTWLASWLLIGALTGYWLALNVFFLVFGIAFLASVISGAIMLLVTAVARSSAAISVISGVAGTFFGFLCGIYMPYSFLGEAAKMAGSLFPFTHLAIWAKRSVLLDALSQAGIEGPLSELILDDYYSASSIGFMGIDIDLPPMILYSIFFAMVCFAAAYILLRKSFRTGRKS